MSEGRDLQASISGLSICKFKFRGQTAARDAQLPVVDKRWIPSGQTANPISSPGGNSQSKSSPRIPLENFRATIPEESRFQLCVKTH